MIEIKSIKDIEEASKTSIPKKIIVLLKEELATIKNWCDEDEETTLADFNTDDFGYGYIVVLNGNESLAELQNIGLTEGLENVIPEAALTYYVDGNKWTKLIVIYNDSYSMSIWLKNSSMFKEYEVQVEVSGNRGDSGNEPF